MTPPDLDRFLSELRRRRVYRVVVGYAAAVFVLLQVADLVLPALGVAPRWYRRLVLLALGGFPVAVILSWMFEWTVDGLRRDAGAGTAILPGRMSTARFSVGVLGLGALGLGIWWLRPALVSAKVAAGADVVAVLPFRATSVGAELGEGMVDLLSTNLDEVGPIRTLDPVRVLRALDDAGGSAVDEEAARTLGARLGAGSVLVGSAVAAGPAVRLSAELLAVDGGTLARARVEGPAEDALALVDSLSMRLVREIWVARESVPTAELSAVTTGSMDALREYLQGEHWFRASRFDSAAAHFERAVEIDTAFALAHMRLSNTYGWSELQGAQSSVAAMERAWRFADRLPRRERAVLRAARLWTVDDDGAGALDSLRAYVGRYPDDVHAWELVADIQFHERVVLGLGDSVVLAAFEQVNRLDPLLGPALIHPLSMTLGRDSAAYRTWLERYERAAGEEAGPYRRIERVLWVGADTLPAVVDELAERRAGLAAGLVRAAIEVGRTPGREVLEAAGRLAPFAGDRASWLANASHYYAALGRTARAGRVLDSLEQIVPRAAANLRAVGTVVGLGPPLGTSTLERLADAPPPWGEVIPGVLQAADALRQGRPDEAGRYLDQAAAVPDPESAGAAGFVGGVRGRALVARGDTAAGLDLMASALARLAEGDERARGNRHLFRFPWLAVRAAWSGGPPSAMADLEEARLQLPQQDVLRHEALARAYETRGDTARALAEYRALLTLWDDVDGDVLPRVEAARRAMTRLGG